MQQLVRIVDKPDVSSPKDAARQQSVLADFSQELIAGLILYCLVNVILGYLIVFYVEQGLLLLPFLGIAPPLFVSALVLALQIGAATRPFKSWAVIVFLATMIMVVIGNLWFYYYALSCV
jgi:hypothetical protein